jgi:hypothetical protein
MSEKKGSFFVSRQGPLGEFPGSHCLICGSTSTVEKILQGESLYGEMPTRIRVCSNGHPVVAEQKPPVDLSKAGLSWQK